MPVLPFVPLIVGGVTSVAGAISNKKAQNKQQQIQEQAISKQNELIDQQKEGSKLAYDYAKQFFPRVNEFLNPVAQRAKNIFTGDAQAINEEIAPEANAFLTNVSNQEKDLTTFSSRGTVGTKLIDSFFRKSAELANMRSTARTNAGTTMQNLGSIFANLASANLANASGSAASASNQLLGQQQLASQNLQSLRSEGTSIGKSIGQLIGLFNWQAKSVGDFFGTSGGGSTRPRRVFG